MTKHFGASIKHFNDDEKNKLLKMQLQLLEDIIINRELVQKTIRIFSNFINVKPNRQIKNVLEDVTCLCNMIRLKMIKLYKLEEPSYFEISHIFVFL